MNAPVRPLPLPGVLAIDPYVPGKSAAPGVAKVFKLSSNETPLGASPKPRIAAYAGARRRSWSSIPTAPRPRCARRSAPATASTPPASSAAPAPTRS